MTNLKLISNQQNFILSRKIFISLNKKNFFFFVDSRGQQNKGLNYDTTLEFFDEIDPKVSHARTENKNRF